MNAAGSDSADSSDDPDGDGEQSRPLAFRAVLAVFALLGLAAVVVGFGGLGVVFTGGTDSGDTSAAVPALAAENLSCDSLAGEPEIGHEGTVAGNDQTGALLDSVSRVPGSSDLLLAMTGNVVAASARRADGTSMTVVVEEDAVVVENGTAGGGYRLWIDSVDSTGAIQSASVIRSRLDICP